jgi:hypothetical protein
MGCSYPIPQEKPWRQNLRNQMKAKHWFLTLIFFGACKDKFSPDVHFPPAGFLVVEGYINTAVGPTTITLTRAASLDSIAVIPEPGAEVEIQSESGESYPLPEKSPGTYTIDQVPVNPGQEYRMHIKTSNGKDYLSDLAEVKISPPIDTIEWNAGPDEVTVNVSTHDDQNKSLYYQWAYEETWEYHSAYDSKLEYIKQDSTIINRPNSDLIYTCWSSDQSTDILIASTVNLNSDVVYQFPLTHISYTTTNKLILKYSILVKQMVLSKDWYEWKQKLKKNTEQLGSIFDPQPSQTGGNVHCTTDPGEMVVGFIGCTSQTEKRIYINRSQIPTVNIFSGYEICSPDSVGNDPVDFARYFGTGFGIPIQPIHNDQGNISEILASSGGCVDCRLRGGTVQQPDFWQP